MTQVPAAEVMVLLLLIQAINLLKLMLYAVGEQCTG